jgi:hypothetical protein
MYNCPATNITAANAIANIALANCETSFILCFHALKLSPPCWLDGIAAFMVVAVVRGGADVGSQSTDTIKTEFYGPIGRADRVGIKAAGPFQILKRNLMVLVELERDR